VQQGFAPRASARNGLNQLSFGRTPLAG